MQMMPIKSSNLLEVGHDPTSENTMRIQFQERCVRSRRRLTEHHAGLLAADSPGGYFHAHLKGKYDFKKVQEMTFTGGAVTNLIATLLIAAILTLLLAIIGV